MSEPTTTQREWEPDLTPESEAAFDAALQRFAAEKAAGLWRRDPDDPTRWYRTQPEPPPLAPESQ